MALSRDIVLRLLGDSSSATKALDDAAKSAGVLTAQYRQAEREMAKQTTAMQKAAAAQSAAHKQIGLAAVAMGAGIALGLGVAVKAAIDWESAFAGVAKTVEGTPEQLNVLEQSLRGLALILPVTHQEIAAVAEAAGQLGIAREDLVAFTATAIALGETTNLSATDAATGLAQLANVMGTSADDTDRLGSALVALGNNGASTEADILSMSQRIAGAGAVIGLSEGDVLGLASAMSSLGIEAEAGGSAISKVLIDMATAVDEGGAKLEQLAAVAGMTGAEFSRLFAQDAAGALAAFTTGLGKVEEQGGSTFATLEQLGYSEVRTRDALLRLSAGTDVLTSSLRMGNSAFEDNNALLEEAAKRYATTEAQLAMARNALVDAGIDIGSSLVPVLLTVSQVVQGLVGFFQGLPGPVQAVVVALAALSAVGLLTTGGFTAARGAMESFSATAVAAGGSVSKFGVAAKGALAFVGGPFGIALAAAAFGIGALAKASAEADARVQELTAAIQADSGALGENTRMALVNQLGKQGLLEDADALGIGMTDLVDAMLGERDALELVNAAIADNYAPANQHLNSLTDEQAAARSLTEALEGTNGELEAAQEAYRLQEEALGGSTAATGEGATAADALGSAVGAAAAETTAMAAAADALKASLDELTGTYITAAEANAGYEGALDRFNATLAEIGTSGVNAAGQIDLTSEAGRTLQGQFIGLRDAGNEVIDSLVRQGDVSGALAADQRLRENFLAAAAAAGIESGEANRLADSILGVPTQRHTEITTTAAAAAAGVRDLYNQIQGLNDREIWVTTNYVTNYQTNYLTQGASPGQARGGYMRGFAGGGEVFSGPVVGPGTGTSDSIYLENARIANGEYVLTAAGVARGNNRAAMDAANYRGANLVAYSGGGMVNGTSPGGSDWGALAAEIRGLVAQVRAWAVTHSHPINMDGRAVSAVVERVQQRNGAR